MFLLVAMLMLASPADVVISEIMYNPDGTSMGPDELMEWVELHYGGEETLNLRGMSISDGTNRLVLEDYLIQPGDYVVVAASAGAFIDLYGSTVPMVEWTGEWTKLRNSGDTVSLYGPEGSLVETVTFLDSWGSGGDSGSPADGDGSTLERIDLEGGTEESNWASSEDWDYRIVSSGNPLCWGTPGERNSRRR
ncbi:MAG: hypothetical protein AVO35_05865 [Candidatus Aegiribacteria sp. MLS_C]|nr:MAG: hypothetical protein AVO35_05865 [Candidatus Aegiribacteria sp. MLS_C]